MRGFSLALISVLLGLSAVLVYGDSAERRYESDACQYRMIYNYSPEPEMGLVTLGGSVVRVATSARHFNEILHDIRPGYAPVHNLSHSSYSVEKEYVILRDLLEEKTVKTVLVMTESRARSKEYGFAHPEFLELARLSDIPLTMWALWPESPIAALDAARGIIVRHLKLSGRVGQQPRDLSDRDCDGSDKRLKIAVLEKGERLFGKFSSKPRNWNLNSPKEVGFLRWMEAYRELSEKTGTQIIFILNTGTIDYPVTPNVEAEFRQKTGMHLITLSPELHALLSPWGKRDHVHLNAKGREIFIPWLIERIEEKCERADGCF